MNLSRDELKSLLSKPSLAARNPHLQSPEPKQNHLRQNPAKPHPRKEKGAGRCRVIVESHRARLCDPDNLYVKPLLDAMRYNGLIADDSPDHIELVTRQVKTKRAHEMTVVMIQPL